MDCHMYLLFLFLYHRKVLRTDLVETGMEDQEERIWTTR